MELTRSPKSLLPVLEQEAGNAEAALVAANEALSAFGPQFEAAHGAGLRRKLGLFMDAKAMRRWARICSTCMAANRADFTLTFRRLCDAAAGPAGDEGVRALFADPGAYDPWAVVAPASGRRALRSGARAASCGW